MNRLMVDSVISTVILDVYVSTMDLTVIGGHRPGAADLDRMMLVSPAQSARTTSAARMVSVRLLHSHFKQKNYPGALRSGISCLT